MATQGIIFDLDDTLIDSTTAYAEALKEVGIQPSSAAYERARSVVKERLPPGHVSSHNRTLYFKALLEAKGEFSGQRVLDLVRTFENSLYRIIALQWERLKRGILIEALRRDYAIGLLTNENARTQMVKLAAIDPFGVHFKHVVTSEEVGYEKPDHRPFKIMADRLEVAVSDCWVVGDSLRHDIEPALSLGCRVIWTQEFSKSDSKRIDAPTVTSLNEITQWLKHRKAS